MLTHDGGQYVPVFTSQQQLLRARPGEGGYRRIEGRALARIVPGDLGLALNPGGDLAVALPPEAVRGLGEDIGQGPGTIPAGAEVMVGAPAEERPDVHEAVAAFAREHAEVRAAYRALVLVREAGERPRYVIGLELEPSADQDALLSATLAAAAAVDGPPPEMVPVDREHPTQITRWMLEVGGPFYRS